jgi:hypothetical protein
MSFQPRTKPPKFECGLCERHVAPCALTKHFIGSHPNQTPFFKHVPFETRFEKTLRRIREGAR